MDEADSRQTYRSERIVNRNVRTIPSTNAAINKDAVNITVSRTRVRASKHT